MAWSIKFHKVAAFAVLVAAAAWVGTGEFARVGGEVAPAEAAQASAEAPPPAPAESAPGPRTVAAIVPEFVDHAREIRIAGVTAPDKRAVLAARSSGIIEKLNLTKGSVVEADALVMKLEGPDLLAALTIAKVDLDQKQRELDVAEKLFERGNMAELQVISARSAKLAAEASLAQAQALVDQLVLLAPFTGLVDSVEVERGEWVQVGAPIATLLALDPIVVQAEVSELDMGFVAPGAEAQVQLVNGTHMVGKVRFVAREASSDTRTFRIEVALPNPGYLIPSGMTADVRLYTDPIRTVRVPRSVITLSDKGQLGLRVVGADNIARFAAVDLIDDTPEGLVLGGVPEGVRIIVAGQDLVREGEEVIAVAAPETAGSAAAGATE